MSKLDIGASRKQIASLIDSNRNSLSKFEHADDYSIIKFSGQNYTCEVMLTEKWIGYDLDIYTPQDMRGIGIVVDTDNYPIDREEHKWFAQEIYNDLMLTVKALLNGEVKCRAEVNETFYARKNDNGTYYLKHSLGKGRWIFKYVQIEENKEASEAEISQLKLVSVS